LADALLLLLLLLLVVTTVPLLLPAGLDVVRCSCVQQGWLGAPAVSFIWRPCRLQRWL